MNFFSGSLKIITLVVLAALVAMPAQADFDKRWYIGVGGGLSMIEPDPVDSGYLIDEDSDTGAKLFLGWDFSRRFGLEGYVVSLGESALVQDPAGPPLTPPRGTVRYQAGGLAGLFYLFNTQGEAGRMGRTGMSLVGKLGAGVLDTESDELTITQQEDFHVMYGLGLEYAFESGLAARAEYEVFDTDAHLASLNLLWRFGRNGQSSVRASAAAAAAAAATAEKLREGEVDAESEIIEREDPVALVEETGATDSDSDGVTDVLDTCPGSAPNVAVDGNGCPLFDKRLEGVSFLSGSATLTADAESALAQLASDLEASPSVRIAIMAHTDNQGPAAGNLELSKKRAIAVARYLVSLGIAGNRLRPEAYGESQPLVSNATENGRQQNRRVEFRTLQ